MARANAVITGRVPVPPGAYVRTGPARPFDIPLRPYPPYVPTGYQNQYSANQPQAQGVVSVVASNLGGIFGDLADAVATPSWAAYAAFAAGLVAGGVGGFFAGRHTKRR